MDLSFLISEETVHALMAYYVFMSFVQSLPDPVETDGKWYRFLYRFLHSLSANWAVLRRDWGNAPGGAKTPPR